jgi:hypothetical protein
MYKSWMTLVALLACVIALGLFAWLKPPKTQGPALSVSTLKSADARTLRVLRKGKPLALLEKRGNDWFLLEPLKAPADSFQVLRLLAVLDAKSALHYPPSDLTKFELNAPQTEIFINDQRFAFGAINNVTREQYVLTQNQVYPLELRFAAAVPNTASALVRRSLLAPGDVPVRFDFGTFTVAADDKKWTTTPPVADLSQDDYNHWVAQWREGSALRAEAIDPQAAPRKSLRDIHITLKDGNKVTLAVVQSEPELVLQRADLDLQFVFVSDMGKKMLSPPVAPAIKK